jgi:hypothetical protein
MSDLCSLIWCALIRIFQPRAALQAENLVLRHQLNVLRRKSPKRLVFGDVDRLVFTALYRVAPGVLDALKILNPQTVIACFYTWRGATAAKAHVTGPGIVLCNALPEFAPH